MPENAEYSESDLEKKIIDKLEHFLLELGTGFTFVARQKRISFDDKHFRIDLVFYNRVLRSFVLIDLKIGELKHQDIGQMQMYVNYYDEEGVHFTYVKKPNIDTLKSLILMFNGTRIGGSEKVVIDDELKLSTATGLSSIFKMKAVKLKKL